MDKNTLYPFKGMLLFFMIFFIGDIFFSAIFYTTNSTIAVKSFLIGIIISLAMSLLVLFLNGIKLFENKLIIKLDSKRGYEKFVLKYKTLKSLEYRKLKAVYGLTFTFDIFLICFNENGEEKILKVNNNMYFSKDLINIFDYLSKTYNIPLNKFEEN